MSDLRIPIQTPRTRGRAAKSLHAELARELTPADLSSLESEGRAVPATGLKALRERHHQIARLLAAGTRPGDVAAMTGYSLSRISILQADPQFSELLHHYATHEDAAYADLRQHMTTMSLDALQELSERMETNPDDFSPALLLEIGTRLADRVGHAPKAQGSGTTEVHVHINERMEKAKARLDAARERRAAQIIDLEAARR